MKRANPKKLILLTLDCFSNDGGIQNVCRTLCYTLQSISEQHNQFDFEMKSMYDHSADIKYLTASRFRGFNGNLLNFFHNCLLNYKKQDVIVISHINLLSIAVCLKYLRKQTKVILIAHGTEVWRPLASWKIWFLKKHTTIWAVSQYTKNRIVETHQLHPLITTIVFTVFFGKVIDMPTDGIPKPIFYLTGLAIWNYFSECTLRISGVFKENRDIFGKVYFPRVFMPLTTAISMAVRLAIQIILIGMVLCWFNWKESTIIPTPSTLILLLPIVLITTLQAIGIGLITASITIKYRDLNFLIAFGLQMMMYSTTILLPLADVPEKFKILIQINPMTTVIEAFRFALLGHGDYSIAFLGYSFLISILLFTIGLTVFNRVEKTFIDII